MIRELKQAISNEEQIISVPSRNLRSSGGLDAVLQKIPQTEQVKSWVCEREL